MTDASNCGGRRRDRTSGADQRLTFSDGAGASLRPTLVRFLLLPTKASRHDFNAAWISPCCTTVINSEDARPPRTLHNHETAATSSTVFDARSEAFRIPRRAHGRRQMSSRAMRYSTVGKIDSCSSRDSAN